ncbi:hypothetical protein FRC03_012396 [Tulasnella sp. 419]|nr:hypothetical protein FRC03_012396 [Tulasnella sp. 419]
MLNHQYHLLYIENCTLQEAIITLLRTVIAYHFGNYISADSILASSIESQRKYLLDRIAIINYRVEINPIPRDSVPDSIRAMDDIGISPVYCSHLHQAWQSACQAQNFINRVGVYVLSSESLGKE